MERELSVTVRPDPEEPRLFPEAGTGAPREGVPSFGPPEVWRRHLATVLRSKWLVLGVTIGGTLLGVLASRALNPTYMARAVLWVEVTDPRDRNPNPLGPGLLGATGWVDLLRSHAVLDDVAREQRLHLTPASATGADHLRSFQLKADFRPGAFRVTVAKDGRTWRLETSRGTPVDSGASGDSIGTALGFNWAPAALPAGEVLEFNVASSYEVARGLGRDLRVVAEPGSNFIRLELRGTDPERLAAIVNAVAARFVAVAADLKRRRQSELVRIFGEQLQHAGRRLTGAEAGLRAFRVNAAPLLAEGGPGDARRAGRDPAQAGYLDLRSEQEQLRRDRVAIERLLVTAGDSGLSVDALEFIGPVQRSAELSLALRELTTRQADIRALRYRYTDDNPEVRRVATQIAALRHSTIPALARALAAELGTREADVNRLVGAASGGLRRLPTLLLDDARLSREVQSAEEVFTRIQQRYGEAQLAEVSSLPDVRILDAAVPPEAPLGDVGKVLILLSIFGSFGIGVLGAVVLDRLDRTVHDVRQVTAGFGLNILGALPHLRSRGDGSGSAQAVEALRGIRMNLMHTYGAAGPLVVTVSSPSTGDGKSFVTMNLALAFADAGFPTLLVDGDIRRGRLHRVLGLRRKPGLTDVLAGAAPMESALQATSRADLTFLGGGSRTRTGPELLSSSAMPRLLVDLRARYRVILVDSPPLAAGVEPYVLGTLTGNLLLVLRMGMTDRELAEGKLDALDRLPIRVLGAVLNGVRSPDVYRRYAYSLEGYELHDEESTWADDKILRVQR